MAEEKKKSILVVEDDPQVQEVLKWILKEEGYEVSLEADGKEALKRLHELTSPFSGTSYVI